MPKKKWEVDDKRKKNMWELIKHYQIRYTCESLFGAVLFSHTNSVPATNYLSANNIFLSQQINTSHQPPISRTRHN
jgi:hypothetical protein